MKQVLDKAKETNMAIHSTEFVAAGNLYYQMGYSKGFEEGIADYLQNLWHDANEEQPEKLRPVLITDGEYYEILFKCAKVYENRRWCYLEDILPNKIEE